MLIARHISYACPPHNWGGTQGEDGTCTQIAVKCRGGVGGSFPSTFIPYGNRTRVFASKRRRPGPLDERNQRSPLQHEKFYTPTPLPNDNQEIREGGGRYFSIKQFHLQRCVNVTLLSPRNWAGAAGCNPTPFSWQICSALCKCSR